MLSAAGAAAAVVLVLLVVLVRDSFVLVLWRWKEPDLRDVVGVMGELLSLMGEVGESRSLEPFESFVRFFLRKPRVGIGGAARGMRRPCPACSWTQLRRSQQAAARNAWGARDGVGRRRGLQLMRSECVRMRGHAQEQGKDGVGQGVFAAWAGKLWAS